MSQALGDLPFRSSVDRANAAAMMSLANVRLVVGDYATVRAIWSEPHTLALDRLDACLPTATIAESDYPCIERAETIRRDVDEYRVVGVEPDGFGLVTLRLERVL